ncbi:MAG: tetratricopeptide repeat protein [Roseivirga sp.]|nr:tetratricopeptide repeat protein [Roseivirga sp.]
MRFYLAKIALLIFLIPNPAFGQGVGHVSAQIDSLKMELSTATDSLEVADLCYALYRKYTFEIKSENSEMPDYLFRALRIYENSTEYGKLADVYNALAGFHYNRNLLEKAREYWTKSNLNYQKSGNDLQVAKSFNNLSLAYDYKDSLKLTYILKAIDISIAISDSTILGSAYNNLSAYYKVNEDYEKAEAYLIRSIKTAENIGKITTQQAGYFDLGLLKKTRGQSSEAIAYIEKSLTFNAIRSTDPNVMGAYEALVELYEARGDYDRAFYFQKQLMNTKDTLFNAQVNQRLLSLTSALEIEKSERTIDAQQSRIDLFEKENQLKNQRFIFFGVGFVVICIMVYLWKSRQFTRKRARLQEGFAQSLIKNVEQERKRISSELHDSVGQHLILLKNQAKVRGTDEMVETVGATLEEVRSITQDLHPVVLGRLGLTAALEEMLEKLDESSEVFFDREVENIDQLFSDDDALNIYRIIQEALNNLIKHAQAASARFQVKRLENKVLITLQDNGKGFAVEEKRLMSQSLGLKTLFERAEMLKARFNILSGQEGTRLTLELNISNRV